MSKALAYAVQSLASTGFCVLDARIATALRPDIFQDGVTARGELSNADAKVRIDALPAVAPMLARFDGRDGLIPVIARSDADLARRISNIVGVRCERVFKASDLAGERMAPEEIQSPARQPGAANRGDLWAGKTTKQPGKTCSECAIYSAGGTCTASGQSGIVRPEVNTLRRCVAFRPPVTAVDGRDGRTLWPELSELTRPEMAVQG